MAGVPIVRGELSGGGGVIVGGVVTLGDGVVLGCKCSLAESLGRKGIGPRGTSTL